MATTWGDVYNRHIRAGEDHGGAAYAADEWEKRQRRKRMPLELKVTDNDKDQITVTLADKEIRGWSYSHQQEQYWKMQMAHEFVEGWYQAMNRE